MTRTAKQFYEFGPYRVDAAERQLLRTGEVVPLTPKVFDTLLVLVENSGHILSKNEVMKRVWADVAVEEASLTKNISTLRKALGQTPETDQYIETIPWRGYRFVAEVREVSEESAAAIIEERSASRLTIEHEHEMDAPAEGVLPATLGEGAATASGGREKDAAKWRARPIVTVLCAALIVAITATVWLLKTTKKQQQTPPVIRTIAVLPFKSLSSEAADDYLGLGMADTLIIRLSNIKHLIIRPTSSVRRYAGNEQDPLVAGQQQQVDAVLDGSIQKTEGRIRLTARLIRVDDGSSLWAGSFDEKDEDIFRLQDAIVERLAYALTSKLTGEEQRLLTKRYTENTQAYVFYLKGRYHLERRTPREVEKSIDYFQQAIDVDPQYALAYAGLAESYPSRSVLGAVPAKEVMPKAKTAVERALGIDDQLAEAYTSLGLIRTIYDWDWAGAEQAHRRALELNPNSATAHRIYGHLLRVTARFDEALVEFNRAAALEPLSLVVNRDLGAALYFARRYDQAIEQLQKTIDLDPNFVTTYGFLERAYEAKGQYEEAVESDLKTSTINGDNPAIVAALKRTFANSGWKAYWLKRLEMAREQSRQASYVEPYQMVRFYARLGERERAFEWLEKAYEERNFWLSFIKIDPLLDDLRTDPRFDDLLKRVGLL